MVLQRQPFFWHIGINRSYFDGTRRWPGSHASRLFWHITHGVMPPRARAKAVSHTNAPTSTLSPVALASLLCSECRELSMAVMASCLVAQHLHERTRPRVERVWIWDAGVGMFCRVHVPVYVWYVRRERRQSDCHAVEGCLPWISLWQCGIQCNLASFPFL